MGLISLRRQNEIDSIVNDILSKLDKTYPENNLEDIIESYDGLKAVEVDFGDDRSVISGAVSYDSGSPRIFINKDLTPARKTFTLAHEFGHYILHRDGKVKFRIDTVEYDNTKESQEETEANYFAATLLMPKNQFLRVFERLRSENLVADYFGVSLAAVRSRISWIKMN